MRRTLRGIPERHRRGRPLEPCKSGVDQQVRSELNQFILSRRLREPTGTVRSLVFVECIAARTILSAQLDQEAEPDEARVANAHLGRCADCSRWWTSIGSVTRALRVRPAEQIPDIATQALARSRHRPRTSFRLIRLGLALLASVELVFAISGVVAGRSASPIHDTQHIGAFGAAVAGALLFVAWRPGRAGGLMPLVFALGFAIPTFATVDVINSNLTIGGGVHHLVQMCGLSMVWFLSGRRLAGPGKRTRRPTIHFSAGVGIARLRTHR